MRFDFYLKQKMRPENCIMSCCVLMAFMVVEGITNDPDTEVAEKVLKNGLEKQVFQMEREKYSSKKDYAPIKRSRRSTRHLNARSRREVRTLVEALKINAEKLVNLTTGVEFLVQSTKAELTGYADIIQRLEHMHPFFVSMFVMLADVAFSTSSRISNQRDQIFKLSNNFRENIVTPSDRDTFDKSMLSVFSWYIRYLNFSSCVHVRDAGFRESGPYIIRIQNADKWLSVWCDQKTDGGGWLVIQRRQDGSEDFYRTWSDYKDGFGDIRGEFWIGNDNLHLLTTTNQELRVDLMDFKSNTAYAKYTSFAVGSASEDFNLSISGYSGTAGDSMASHNGMKFSATDRDNDNSSLDCVMKRRGCWWYENCGYANLNGWYCKSFQVNITCVRWFHWKNKYESLKGAEMKIRPSD